MPEPLLDNELARRIWEREELEQYAQDTQLMTSSMEGDSQESKVSVDAEEMRISALDSCFESMRQGQHPERHQPRSGSSGDGHALGDRMPQSYIPGRVDT